MGEDNTQTELGEWLDVTHMGSPRGQQRPVAKPPRPEPLKDRARQLQGKSKPNPYSGKEL